MIIHDRCDKTNLPYPSWTDTFVNEYDHCTRKVIRKIYCMCTFPKEYGGCDHYLVSWEAPYENSHCWLDRGQLWSIITCDGMRKIDNWSCSFCSWLHMLQQPPRWRTAFIFSILFYFKGSWINIYLYRNCKLMRQSNDTTHLLSSSIFLLHITGYGRIRWIRLCRIRFTLKGFLQRRKQSSHVE